MERSCLLLGGYLLIVAAGCAYTPPPLFPVHGTVNLDGVPMASGKICFVHAGKAILFPVKSGHFEGQAPAGVLPVAIYAFPQKGEPNDRENYLPARFNKETTLSAEVVPAGPNEFTFEVTSQ